MWTLLRKYQLQQTGTGPSRYNTTGSTAFDNPPPSSPIRDRDSHETLQQFADWLATRTTDERRKNAFHEAVAVAESEFFTLDQLRSVDASELPTVKVGILKEMKAMVSEFKKHLKEQRAE